MSEKSTIYEIAITDDGLDTYSSYYISAKDMAENLGIDSVMTDFEWEEDLNRGLILTGRILDDISVEDALSELKSVEYIEGVNKS